MFWFVYISLWCYGVMVLWPCHSVAPFASYTHVENNSVVYLLQPVTHTINRTRLELNRSRASATGRSHFYDNASTACGIVENPCSVSRVAAAPELFHCVLCDFSVPRQFQIVETIKAVQFTLFYSILYFVARNIVEPVCI